MRERFSRAGEAKTHQNVVEWRAVFVAGVTEDDKCHFRGSPPPEAEADLIGKIWSGRREKRSRRDSARATGDKRRVDATLATPKEPVNCCGSVVFMSMGWDVDFGEDSGLHE